MLLERDAELDALAVALDGPGRGSGALVHITGPAGIGKSALLHAADELACERNLMVLGATAGELERQSSFSVMRQLFEPTLRSLAASERAEVLAGAAAPAAGLLGVAQPALVSEPAALDHALFWVATGLAERGPLALIVDDAHWCDPASLRALLHLALRIEHVPIALVVALRLGERGAPAELLDRLASVSAACCLSLASLSESAATALMREQLPAASGEFCRAAFVASAGNPFYLRELTAAVVAARMPPTAANAAQLRLIGPDAVVRSIILRLEGLPEQAAEVARWLSVLDDNIPLAHVAALAQLTAHEALSAVDALAAVEIVRAAHPLSFVHAIVRTAIYDSLAPAERSRRHAAAALLLEQQGASAQGVAAHLLRTAPAGNQQTIAWLRRAAEADGFLAASDTASAYLERALAEPPEPGQRAQLLFMLGGAQAQAGHPEAIEHLRAALQTADDPRLRNQIAQPLAALLILQYRAEEAVATIEQLIEELHASHPQLARQLEVFILVVLWVDIDGHQQRLERLAGLDAPVAADTPVDRALLSRKAWAALMTGEPAARVRELARAALASGDLIEEDPYAPGFEMATRALAATGAIQEAHCHLQQNLSERRRRGWIRRLAVMATSDAYVTYQAGELAHAEENARQALRLLEPGDALRDPAIDALIDALIERDALDEAWALLAQRGYDKQLPSGGFTQRLWLGRGRLRLAGGDLRGGLADVLNYGQIMQRLCCTGPAFGAWRLLAAITHVQLGEHEQAQALADDELELARRFGEPPWESPCAWRGSCAADNRGSCCWAKRSPHCHEARPAWNTRVP